LSVQHAPKPLCSERIECESFPLHANHGEEIIMAKFNWGTRVCGVSLLWALMAAALPAQTFTRLHSFDGTDGNNPYAALVQATDGHLYGTTAFGGASGDGTVFTVTTSGSLTSLHSFDGSDGDQPYAGLIQATNGQLYGTALAGGANEGCFSTTCGVVFKITPRGALTTLYSFCSQSNCVDGFEPYAGLIQAANGKFYGVTVAGGTMGNGTVFNITPGGALTTLYSFCSQGNCTDGASPQGTLVQATNGNFYGATPGGGANGGGTIFKITPSGMLTTLYSFCSQGNCTDGYGPFGALVQATDGSFYGTTIGGGANDNGTVFKIAPSGALTILYSFCSQGGTNCTDGKYPQAELVQGTDGNFYGTTNSGGTEGEGAGTIFEITPSGALTTLHSFDYTDGVLPQGALVQDTNGKFYGTTVIGGAHGDGTVFSLSVGLGPFVEANPTSGRVGKAVNILGTNLAGTTSVTFHGIGATFTLVSSSWITTTVPPGATTGTVQVVTPGNTLSSNVPFTVTP
jgi:uncharacterized repeat protein (TIGR03803 family)